jgi:hypothetical protein
MTAIGRCILLSAARGSIVQFRHIPVIETLVHETRGFPRTCLDMSDIYLRGLPPKVLKK